MGVGLLSVPPDYVARAISDYLTSETGVTIIFESAIVPKWKDSRISFKHVYVSRRPSSSSIDPPRREAYHLAAVGYDVSNHPSYHHFEDDEDEYDLLRPGDEDWNMSLFDLNIDSVDVTLSLWRWLDGKGLVEDAVVKGVRGVLGTSHSTMEVIYSNLQIVGPYTGILRILLILPIFDTSRIPETLSWNLCNWKTFF